MPRQKDLKRLVRTRMTKTGEAYSTARAQLLKKRNSKSDSSAASAKAVAPDYAALAGMSDAKVAEKTGHTWAEWVELLDREGAAVWQHRDIVGLLNEKYDVPGWWTQMVTVGYERIKGRRARGQRLDGSYEASKSRTFNVPVATLFDAWADVRLRKRWLSETGVKVRTATAPKAMRLGWSDGTIVAVWFTAKGKDKSTVALAHTKLADRATADRLKKYWSERLDDLREVLKAQ